MATDLKRRPTEQSPRSDGDELALDEDEGANLQRHFSKNSIPTLERGSCKSLNSGRTSLDFEKIDSGNIDERREESGIDLLEKDEEEALVAEEVPSEEMSEPSKEMQQANQFITLSSRQSKPQLNLF